MFLCSGGGCIGPANLFFGKQNIRIYSFKGI